LIRKGYAKGGTARAALRSNVSRTPERRVHGRRAVVVDVYPWAFVQGTQLHSASTLDVGIGGALLRRRGMSTPQSWNLGEMMATLEARYFGVAAHVDRVSRYTEIIAEELGVAASSARTLRGAARLHDVGKLATPDWILLKPGPLTATERSVIELHTLIGYDLLRNSETELLDTAAVIALSHHERWDGTGYPHQLSGDGIPIEARIAALADAFDSLTRERPYRPALNLSQALELVREGRGTQFDPDVVDAFFVAEAEIRRVHRLTG
jgi:response regulator RpfG family c-di-GMP phosphodiesterase